MTGHWEIVIIGLIFVLLFVGPKKLPGLGKSLGESIRGFKKAMKEDDTLDVTESAKHEQISGQNSNGQKVSSKHTEDEKA